jgi:hypothetical protein
MQTLTFRLPARLPQRSPRAARSPVKSVNSQVAARDARDANWNSGNVWTIEEIVNLIPKPVAKKRRPHKPRAAELSRSD